MLYIQFICRYTMYLPIPTIVALRYDVPYFTRFTMPISILSSVSNFVPSITETIVDLELH